MNEPRTGREVLRELKATMPRVVKLVWYAGEAYGRARGLRWGLALGYRLGRF